MTHTNVIPVGATVADRDAISAFTSEGGRVAGAPDEQRLASLGITFDGRDYRYQTYRYQRLEDALAYAELQREKGSST